MNKAAATRQAILQKAFEMTYRNGYKATSIDAIIAHTDVTKGAFFYHFRNKDEMGLAILNEILKPMLTSSFAGRLEAASDPLDAIYHLMHVLLLETSFMRAEYGCPVANLVYEMAPGNEAFTRVLDELSEHLIAKLTALLSNGKANGLVGKDVHPRQAVQFILSGYWGIRNLVRLQNARRVYASYLKELKRYLNTLR